MAEQDKPQKPTGSKMSDADRAVMRKAADRRHRGGRVPSTVWEAHIAEIAEADGRSFEEADDEAKLLSF